jgi:hypothetical protein
VRPILSLREPRRVHAAVGVAMLGIPASAAAVVGSNAVTQGNAGQRSSGSLQAHLVSGRVPYAHDVVVDGSAPASDAGQTVSLEYAQTGTSSWRTLAWAKVRRNGRFRLAAPLGRSGRVKVVGTSAPAADRSYSALTPGTAGSADPPSSAPSAVTVDAGLRVRGRAVNVLRGGQPVEVRGTLLPAVASRKVALQLHAANGWQTVASARTGSQGGFQLRYRAGGMGQHRLRVRFAGDRVNGPSTTRAGTVTVYRQTVASWYDDGGDTACGFHAYYGVASTSLPCGAKVAFLYGGRTVTTTVDDRGPYVDGRDWDLNQNTAGALGFDGVASIWSST